MDKHKLFEVSQGAIIKNTDDKILLLNTTKDGDAWQMPGGRLNEGETWLDGLRREVFEETGITGFSVEKVTDVGTDDNLKTYVVTFLCSLSSVPEIKLSSEHQEYVWVAKDELDKYKFWHPAIKERIQRALN